MEDINDVIGSVQRMKKMLFEEAARRRAAKMESLVGDNGDEFVTISLTREQVFYLLDEQKRMVRAVYAVLDALFTATGWTEE